MPLNVGACLYVHRGVLHQSMGKSGTCRGCGSFGKLCKSHIVPEWMLSDIPANEDLKVIQSGVVIDRKKEIAFNLPRVLVKKRLLCQTCEGILGNLESQLRDRLFGLKAKGPLRFSPVEPPITEVRDGIPQTYWLLSNAESVHLALLGILAKFLEVHPGSAVSPSERKALWAYVLSQGIKGSHSNLCALVFQTHAVISTTSVFVSPQEGYEGAIMGFQAGGLKVLYSKNPSFSAKYLSRGLLGIMREDLVQTLGPLLASVAPPAAS